MTGVGTLTVTRRYWQCRCGADGGYAADAIVGLTGRFSRVVQRHGCRLAADVSFATASEHLREMLGVRMAPETLRTVVEAHGRAMAAFQPTDTASADTFRQAAGAVEFAVDAGKVNTREDGWRDLKIAVLSKRPAGAPATPADWCDEDRLPTPTCTLAFARIATAKVFRRDWADRLRAVGVTAFAGIHVLGDGASWIWRSADRALTGCLQTLDIYHACERLSRCAQRVLGEQTAAATAAFARGREHLLTDGWLGVCAWVGELLSVDDAAEQDRRRKATDKLIGYFAKHIGRLNYRERLSRGQAIGSGAVEGQAKTLGVRLKSRGARWCVANVHPMASLVCVRNSVQWDAYWALAA